MSNLEAKFAGLGAENAPGQEVRQNADDLKSVVRGDVIPGRAVDFSHGDVDAFAPTPGAREAWEAGYDLG
ncbi:MAG: pyridoxal phosphate-dependent aminotransferase, partial [Yoonia sp.]